MPCSNSKYSLARIPLFFNKHTKIELISVQEFTEFGLMGHALECVNDLVSFTISYSQVPIIHEAIQLANGGVVPSGSKRNMKYVEDRITYPTNLEPSYQTLLCDAQTSGGLLIAMREEDAKKYIKKIEELSFSYVNIIGEVILRGITPIIIY